MRPLRAWFLRLASFFSGRRQEQELTDELESHLQMHVDDNLRRGMSPADARRGALLKLGGLDQTKEIYRDRRSLPVLETLWQDIRYALRTLRKSPAFTLVAILTLGLGIGANTAIFSVVNAVLLRPLPFANADRLMMVWATDKKSGTLEDVASYPDFEDWKSQTKSFENMAAFTTRGATLAGGDFAEYISAIQASASFFDTLKATPSQGRTFREDEQEAGTSHVVLLSHNFWKTRYAGRTDVLNQTIRVNEVPHTIIGVMPPGFEIPPGSVEQIYTPLVREQNRNHGFLRILGRLRPEISRAAAQSEINVITRNISTQFPKTNKDVGANVVPLADAVAGQARIGLLVFVGVVALVLLIACANVANLVLARSATRQKEFSVRAALGASRARLTRQVLTESAVLALCGGTLGLLLSIWGTQGLVSLITSSYKAVPRADSSHIDGWVLAFTVGVSLLTGLIFGLAPAWSSAAPDLNENLRESGRTSAGNFRSRRLRSIFVVTETALALVLLAGAGLLLKSLLVMRGNATGFQTSNLVTMNFFLPRIKFAHAPERTRFFESVLSRVESLPGVRSAALVANLPLGGGSDSLGFQIPGHTAPGGKKYFSANFNIASHGYFRTMGIALRAGREFGDQDGLTTQGVIVINETAARKFWPGEDAVNKQIVLPVTDTESVTLTVVGVAADVRQASLGTVPSPEIYLAYMQPGPPWPWLVLVIRTDSEAEKMLGTIRTAAQSVDHDVPVLNTRTMDEVLSGSLAVPSLYTLLLGVFASLALLLATVGLYGVVSYTVTQRTHEMGIRLALGAARADVLRLVLWQGMGLAIIGTGIGIAGALAVTRLMTQLIPSVQPGDPLTLAAVCGLLLGVAFAASYLPARRAMRVNPVVALRYE